MSDLVTMEDFEALGQNHHNLSPFEVLLEVASVYYKKLVEKKQQPLKIVKTRPNNPLKLKIKRQRNEEENLINHAIKAPSKTHDERLTHEDLIKEGRQKVQNPVMKTDTLKRKLEETNEEWIEAMEMKRKNMKKRKRGSQNQPTPPPSLSQEFERKIMSVYGGKRIIRVIQKCLTETDVNRGHCRVTIPCSQVESFKFLDGEEMTNLRLQRSMTVPLIHTLTENGMSQALSETSLVLGQWDMHKNKKDLKKVSYQYVLQTNWNTIVENDGLKKGDCVQIWAFRDVDNKLCMALVKL
ncbi:hypothetical protein K1719_030856 [Acacia pycnantha]|nr:hypothetical protein K1719_030856 [Acacia pycnantha]